MDIKSFARGSGILIVSNVLLKAMNFFLMPLYTRYLSTEMLGVSDTITSFTGVVFPILLMGLDSAFSAFYYDSDEKQSKKVFNTILITLLIIGFIPVFCCVFSSELSHILLGSEDYSSVLVIALISITFNIWYMPFALNLRMQNKMLLYSIVNIISSFCMIILNVLFVAILKYGTCSLVLSTMIVQILQCCLFIYANKVGINFEYFDWNLLKRMIKFAVPIVPGAIMSWVLAMSDRYILLHFQGAEAVGLYGVGTRIMTVLNIFISSVSLAYTTFAYGSKNNDDAKEKYIKVFDLLLLILLCMCFTVSSFAEEVVELMTAPSYHKSYVIVRDLLFAQLFYGITTIVSYGILFEKKSSYILMANFLGAISNIILNILLIPEYGISAAAATTCLGYLITFIVTFIFAQKCYHCSYNIRKAIIVLILTYITLIADSNCLLLVRGGVWGVMLFVLLYLYRKTLFDFLSLFIRKRKKN